MPKSDARHPMDVERTLDEMRSLRQDAEMTQQELADLLGVDRTLINKWENKACRPRFSHLVMLHRILHGLRIEQQG